MEYVGSNVFFIYLKGSEEEAEKLNAKWVKSQQAWAIPLNLHSLREAYKVTKDKRLVELGKDYKKQADKAKELKNLKDVAGANELRPYQRVDVNFLKKRRYAGVFNEQRTGKTPTILTTLKELGYDWNIIVVPASLLYNWKDEINKWIPKSDITILNQSKQKRQKILQTFKQTVLSKQETQKFVVVSYETLNADRKDFISTFCEPNADFCLVADEAHRLCSLSNGRKASQQSISFAHLASFANRKYLLTGTPSRSKGHDIWGLLHVMNPERWPGYWQFVDRYFHQKEGFFGERVIGDYKRKEELQGVLDLISTQRKRDEVMSWLPDKQYKTLRIPFTAKQRKAYTSVLDTFEYEEDGELKVDASGQLAQLIRLRQICLDPSVLDIDAPSAKISALKEWLKDNPNEQVVVFSWFTSGLKKVAEELEREKVGMIHGEMDTPERHEEVKRFQQGKTRVLLANIVAAGTGITLDRASTAIFLDRSFVPIENEQAEDRIIPTSKDRNHSVTIIDMIMNDSVEEKIHALLQQKKNIIDVVNDYGLKEVLL